MFNGKILANSLNTSATETKTTQSQLITMQLTFPRVILAEFNTHRKFSRNAASSRAIPITKMIKDVKEGPFIPIHWGKNQKGMQAESELTYNQKNECWAEWLSARDSVLDSVEYLSELGLHKQIANRLLEPWMWVTVIATGDMGAWNNFFALRCHPDAEPHIQKIAYIAQNLIKISPPKLLKHGEWHLPLIGFDGDEGLTTEEKIKVSVGRCARVSYLTHAGVRDPQADIELHDRLQQSKHFSPFEHVAQAILHDDPKFKGMSGNFSGSWLQYRKTLVNEYQNNGEI
jgi:thymidylate synthase ThyX